MLLQKYLVRTRLESAQCYLSRLPLISTMDVRKKTKNVTMLLRMCSIVPLQYSSGIMDLTVDDVCQFHGLHIHRVIYAPYETPISQLQFFRKTKMVLKEFGISLRSEAIRNETAILVHLQQQPRVVMGCTNAKLCGKLVKTMGLNNTIKQFSMDDEPNASTSNANSDFMSEMLKYNPTEEPTNNMQDMINRLANDNVTFRDVLKDRPDMGGDIMIPTTKTANKVDIVMRYMQKYGTTNMDSIVKAIIDIGYTDELNEIRSFNVGE